MVRLKNREANRLFQKLADYAPDWVQRRVQTDLSTRSLSAMVCHYAGASGGLRSTTRDSATDSGLEGISIGLQQYNSGKRSVKQ